MIQISPDRFLDENEINFEYIKASGPGGQNINKISSAVRLRYNIQRSTILDLQGKERFSKLAGSRLTAEGDVIIEARRFRTQELNRQDAIKRLISLITLAMYPPKSRIKTLPTKSSSATRLIHKKKRGVLKKNRRIFSDDWS